MGNTWEPTSIFLKKKTTPQTITVKTGKHALAPLKSKLARNYTKKFKLPSEPTPLDPKEKLRPLNTRETLKINTSSPPTERNIPETSNLPTAKENKESKRKSLNTLTKEESNLTKAIYWI